MFNFVRSRSREIDSVQSIDSASTGSKNDESKIPLKNRTRTQRMGSLMRSILRHFRFFLKTAISRISADDCHDSFTRLPPEIITHVLWHLPLRDRKNVRLTCKLLNHCSKHVSITSMEKFSFPQSHEIPCGDILLRTNSAVLNLKFTSTNFNGVISLSGDLTHVWKTCGDRVRSLSIYGFVQTHDLLDILMYCGGLQSIVIRDVCVCRTNPGADIQLLSVLNKLVELNITRTELRFLKIDRVCNDDLLRTTFTVFPNLERISAKFDDFELKTKCLKPFMRLRSLTYQVAPSSMRNYWSAKRIASTSPKRPDSDLCPTPTESFLFRFLAVQNKLKVLRLSIPLDFERNSGKEVMFHVLRSCPKLREFRFPLMNWKLETSDEVTEFVALISNLDFLTLGCVPSIPNGLSLPSTKFMLRTLAVTRSDYVDTECDEFLLHILRHSPKMRRLSIAHDTRETHFRAAFRCMPELRVLILQTWLCADDIFDDWHSLHVEGFQNLRYMKLGLRRNEALPIRRVKFWRFTLPQYLPIDTCRELCNGYYEVPNDEYHKFLWNMPALQTANLSELVLENRTEAIELVQNMKSLRHLICFHVGSDILRCLFKNCPTLKFLTTLKDMRTFSLDSSGKQIVSEMFIGIRSLECGKLLPSSFDFE